MPNVNQDAVWTCEDIHKKCVFLPWPFSSSGYGHRCKQVYDAHMERCSRCKLLRCTDCKETWSSHRFRKVETIDTNGYT